MLSFMIQHVLKTFEDNDVVIPISVLEELDHFKRGNEQIHFNAREFLRLLDDLSINKNSEHFNNNGKIKVMVNHNWDPEVRSIFNEDSSDNRIINCAFKIQQDNPKRLVILVSKDTNMRLKSRSLGLKAEDYTSDTIQNFSTVYDSSQFIENIE